MKKEYIFDKFSNNLLKMKKELKEKIENRIKEKKYNSSIQITYNNSTELILNLNSINEYICPICLKIFNKKDIDLLSKEHVPPESVGGKIICLTCIPCNTKFGSKIEGSISDYFKSIEFDDIFF